MSWWWSSGSSCPNRRQQCSRTVTVYTSDGRQVTTTYQGGQAVQQVTNPNTTCSNQDTSSEPTKTEPIDGFSQFETECLDEHNKFRAKHGAPPLTLSRNLCNYAQEWANYLASTGSFQHRSNRTYGENLYMSSGMQIDGRTAVRSWYDEIRMYRYGSGFSSSTGHFTQVVWKGSKELGIAIGRRGNSSYVVANYNPPGNYQGQFSSNVLPPTS